MKLIDKKEIFLQKTSERKKEVEEGIKLAKSVDSLRETHSKEQANLKKFRDETLKAIKVETETLISKKDDLLKEVNSLEKRRISAEAPIDLTNEWKKLEIEKSKVKDLKQELFDRETSLITREALVQNIEKREEILSQKEQEAEKYLEEIRVGYRKSEDLRFKIETEKNESDITIAERYKVIETKETELVSREHEVNNGREKIATNRKELLDHETNLVGRESKVEATQRSLFEREEKIKEQEALTKRFNDEASHNYDISESLKIETRKSKEESDKDIHDRYVSLSGKERDLGYRERDLVLQREKVENDKKEIEKEKLHIASQQETLRQAWRNIKNLNK